MVHKRREELFWDEDQIALWAEDVWDEAVHLPSHWLGWLWHFICLSSDWVRTLGEWSSLWLHEEMEEGRP